MSEPQPSRRELLRTALAAGSLGVTVGPVAGLAQDIAPTPECQDGDEPTVRQMDGPFYKARSPERTDLIEPGAKARSIELSGFILDRRCQPVRRVLVDLWHADDNGEYDTRGFRYRGHVLTDAQGHYRFRTIVPALYTGRTRHYHIKLLTTGRQLLTTQLYFPNEPMNARDGLFDRALLVKLAASGDALAARFDFIVDLRQPGA